MKKICLLCCLAVASLLFTTCNKNTESGITEIKFNIPAGFELEEIYHPSKYGQGSWVALAEGPENLMFACDQYGKIYYFKRPEENEALKPADIDSLDIEVGQAHGLLWAFNSLYVSVNKRWDDDIADEEENGSGYTG